MKEHWDPATGKSPDDDKPDPYAGFDTLTVGGPSCKTCGAVVPSQSPATAQLHREWHERTKTV